MANNKVVPFPAVTPTAASPDMERRTRIIVHLGRQRIALDIACRATVLKDPPVPPDGCDVDQA